jgi:glycosyltransferase involved in cell wall biosynthesis
MQILHILNDIRKLGNGIVNVAIDLACLQAQSGHTVAIAAQGGEYEALLSTYGVKHFPLNQTRTPINLIQAAWQYRTIVQTFQPDIVHAHMMTGVVLARVLRGNSRYALVSTVHNEFQRSAIVMGLADRVIAVSQAVAESMAKRGIPLAKLRAVFNGTLGSPRTRPAQDYQPLPLQRPAITTVAGMYHRKGITELITAFSQIATQFPTTHLYLVGNGPDRLEFEAQAQIMGAADRIHFEGFQPEPQRYLIASDIFVLASHKEPAGLVILEAREAGCAIVASNVDGIPQGLDAGKAGILVPPNDASALAQALHELLDNADQMQFWQTQARQNLEWLSVERVHQETMAIYNELNPLVHLVNSGSV